jgi:23S rRNA pseudouridine2605 synthase
MTAAADGGGERIAKRLSRAGVCSRREAERWIAEGRIAIDGKKVTEPGTRVADDAIVTVDGKPIAAPAAASLWRYNKPRGLVVTHKDEKGRPTVFERLPKSLPRVVSVGRLDLTSEGLLLLTNDGALARTLELPSTGWVRRYRVRVYGDVDEKALAALERGVTVEGVRYGPIRARRESAKASNTWLLVSLAEGKNREIRKVMEHLGLKVSRLIRVAYGPFQLGSLPEGEVARVAGKVLAEQLGQLGHDADRRR